jgi:hypothetical protein
MLKMGVLCFLEPVGKRFSDGFRRSSEFIPYKCLDKTLEFVKLTFSIWFKVILMHSILLRISSFVLFYDDRSPFH